MELRYHPFTAFTLVFCAGLLAMILALAILAVATPDLFFRLSTSGFLIYLPFILTAFAAHQSAKGNGPPFIHMLVDDPDALRDHFDKWHLAWTIAFALQASGLMMVLATLLWWVSHAPYPFDSPFTILIIVVINLVCSFQAIKPAYASTGAFRPDSDAVEANPALMAAWAVRRMQKKMNEAASRRGKG